MNIPLPHIEESGETPINFHTGGNFENLASTYETYHEIVYELVQNQVDNGATDIRIRADYSKRSDRMLTVSGNGIGASPTNIAEAFQSFGHTIKTDPDKYGKHGRGFLAPFGPKKCLHFTFAARCADDPETVFRMWEFPSSMIESDLKSLSWKLVPGLIYCPDPNRTLPEKLRSRQKVAWTTRVEVHGVTNDPRISKIDLDELVSELGRRFREAILERNISIKLGFIDGKGNKELSRTVTVIKHTGTPLEVCTYETENGGRTEFKIFLAKKGAVGSPGVEFTTRAQKGRLQRLTAEQFLRCLNGYSIPLRDEIRKAMLSRVFEGEITAEKARLKADRLSFFNDDALWGFCESIERWFEEIGSKYYAKAMRENQDTRLTQIGKEVLDFLAGLTKSMPSVFLSLSDLLPGGSDLGGDGTKSPPKEPKVPPVNPPGPPEPRPPKPPRPPRHHKLGFSLEFASLDSTKKTHELDLERGVLYINMENKLFAHCNTSDSRLRQYVTAVAQIALITAYHNHNSTDQVSEQVVKDILKVQVMNIVNSNVLDGKPGAFREIKLDD